MTTLFVYGTLRRGQINHARFCRGVLDVQEARVRGLLYELPSGIPVLRVADADILAVGTSKPPADAAAQSRFSLDCAECFVDEHTRCDWDTVHGELMVFDDPESRLPLIDRLEGFRPGGLSLYRRVLLPVACRSRVVPAWCYVAGESLLQNVVPTGKMSWP